MHEVKVGGAIVTWFGHASFMITDGSRKIYVDPFVLPHNPGKADTILVTHEHFDHCDEGKIESIRTPHTKIFGPPGVITKLGFGSAIHTGGVIDGDGTSIHVVEAYNINKFRSPGQVFHPRGLGVGYVVSVGGTRIYHSGDTDHIPEMSHLKNIDVAILPIGGTYTMDVHEAAEAAKVIKPKFLVPMHYNSDKYGVTGINANPIDLAKALIGKGIVVNILEPVV